MSFNTNITGNIGGSNQFIFTTTNVSSDNISCENLSATNASIGNLTVTTFSPVNANIVNLSTTNLNASTGNISTLNVSQINSTNISNSQAITSQSVSSNSISSITLETNQATFNVSLTVPVIFSEDVFIDNLLNVSTVNGSIGGFNTVNANQINAFVEIDALKLNTSNISVSNQINASVGDFNLVATEGIGAFIIFTDELFVDTNISSTEINASQINASAISTNTIFATTGNFLTINTVQKNVSTINASTANFSSMNSFTSNISQLVVTQINTEFIHSDDIFTPNIDATQANFSNVSVLNQINASVGDFNLVATEGIGAFIIFTDELFVDTNISATEINASQTNSSAINSSTFTNSGLIQSQSLSANTVNSSSIGANQAVFGSLTVTGGINLSTINISTANVSQINASNISVSNISVSNISVANTINASDVEGIVVFASSGMIAPIYVGNISSINGSIETLASGFINTGFLASTTIEAGEINVCNISTGNISSVGTITAQNISLSNNISSVTVNCDAAKATAFILTPLLNASTINVCNMSVVSNLFADNGNFNDLGADVITAATLNGINIQGQTITGNIGGNLAAGFGISLSTAAGITTIENTGGSVTDPLNISTINASTGNFSLINVDNISGMAFSTQYAFQATGNQGDVDNIQPNQILQFNTIQLCVPDASAYQTNNSRYQVQAAGLYQFGFKVFQRSATAQFRLGIYHNETLRGMGGAAQNTTEDITILLQCAVGDLMTVRVVTAEGGPQIFMGAAHSWFFGYRLEPDNAVINISTDLTIASLSATTINASILNCSSGNLQIDDISAENIIVFDLQSNTTRGALGNFSTINVSSGNFSGINYTNLDGEVINTNQIFASNIVSDNVSCNDLNANNIVGNIGTNLVGGSNINISTVSGLSTISYFPTKQLTMFRSFTHAPQFVGGVSTYTPNFNVQLYASPIGTYQQPLVGVVLTNVGFEASIAGFFRFDYNINFRNESFGGRTNVWTRTFVNGVADNSGGRSFCYLRDQNYVQFGTCSGSLIVELEIGDFVHQRCLVAKGNNVNFGALWTGIVGSEASSTSITYLGP